MYCQKPLEGHLFNIGTPISKWDIYYKHHNGCYNEFSYHLVVSYFNIYLFLGEKNANIIMQLIISKDCANLIRFSTDGYYRGKTIVQLIFFSNFAARI